MKIYKIAQAPQQMTPDQINSQKNIQGATSEIMQAVGLINKSFETIDSNVKIKDLFKKDGYINALQSGTIRQLDQNEINVSLEAMASISQASMAINQSLRVIEDEGGDASATIQMAIQSLQVGNFSAFQATMSGFQAGMQGMTGVTNIQNLQI